MFSSAPLTNFYGQATKVANFGGPATKVGNFGGLGHKSCQLEIESGHGCIYLKSVTHLIKIDRAQNIGEVPAFVGKFVSNPVALVPSHNNKE